MTAQPERDHSSSRDNAGSPTSSLPDTLPIGASIGPYVILDRLGQGGMGVVYKARHSHLHRLVALKLLSPHLLHDPQSLVRFQREMRIVGQLDHPHVVRALDANAAEGRP